MTSSFLRSLLVLAFLFGSSDAGPPGSTVLQTIQVPIGGYIDPTISTYNTNRPLQCTASTTPSAGFTEQNRATMQFALNDASTSGKWIWIKRCLVDALSSLACPMDDSCGYPITILSGQPRGVDWDGVNGVTIISDGAVIRTAGHLAGTGQSFQMWNIRGANHLKIIGLTFSMRDVNNGGEQVHAVQIGDGHNNRLVDDLEFFDDKWIEEPSDGTTGGDCLNTVGGAGVVGAPATISVGRVSVLESYFGGCHRDGIDFAHGFQHFKIIGNKLVATAHTNQLIDNEPTTDSLTGKTLIQNNTLDRGASPAAQQLSLSGLSDASLLDGVMVDHNILINCSPGSSLNVDTLWITDNSMVVTGTGGGGDVALSRRASNVWIEDNYISRGPSAVDVGMVGVKAEGTNCASQSFRCSPRFVWVAGNRIEQWVPSPAVLFDSVLDVWVLDNVLVYHNSFNGTSSAGPRGVSFQSTFSADSGWIAGNDWIRGLQLDGITRAGTIYAGAVVTGTPGHFTIRDNTTDGVTSGGVSNFLSGNGTSFPDGVPVVSGNSPLHYTNFIANGWKNYRTEATPNVETLTTSGALSPFKATTFIVGDCGSDTFTLADCNRAGFYKTVDLNTTCTSSGTLTPTHFGDGTSISWTMGPGGVATHFALLCDGSSWWILDKGNATVNP